MDDFASASMLRLLLRAMAEAGLAPPLPLPDAARVPLQHKQQVVSCIVRAGGLTLLLRLAQQVQHIEGEPLHRALIGARDPDDFLARWQRLERYVHASHRVLPRRRGARSLLLEHTSRDAQPPMAAESVAVLGVWIGALRAIGTRGLRVKVTGKVVHGDGATEAWVTAPTQSWQLQWSPRAESPEADAHAANANSHSAMPPLDGPLPWPEPAAELARWLARAPPAAPRVGDAAAALDLPLRTLQRRLTTAGISFSDLLGEVRVRQAAAWLARGGPTLAEIGFLCGYADQAHFTREFTRRAGLPPARYRTAASIQ
ncbi:helix-turn-helix transcriptional regulator [Variovorax sp. LARHSF232]